MAFAPGGGFDIKGQAAKMLQEYLAIQKKTTEVYGKDEEIDIPGFGKVNGTQEFSMVLALNYYNEMGFQMPFQSMFDGYKFIYDLEKQIANAAVS